MALGFGTLLSAHAAGQEQHIRWGDTIVTGYGPFRLDVTPNGRHFIALKAAGKEITLVSQARGLTATCGKVEGNVSNSGVVQRMTMSGGVQAKVVRPSSNQASGEQQTAAASGSTAVYTESNNGLEVTGNVELSDEDPGATRSLHATGNTASMVLSKQAAKELAFQSASIDGDVRMDISGTRLESGKRIPFTLHSKCRHANFDSIARTITLQGNVIITSNDPTLGLDSYTPGQEVIHLAEDGSVESVEGGDGIGSTTVDLGTSGP